MTRYWYDRAVTAVRRHEGRTVLILLGLAVAGVLLVAADFAGPVGVAGGALALLAVLALMMLLIESVTDDA